MRMLGKRFVKRNVSRVVTDQREMRDAILWEVHPEDRLAYVRVQGSNENVVAFYPRHWTTLPVYMKVGTSVRIVHIGGVNKMEISGQGLTIPTPVTGPQYPPLVGGGNGVLTGMGIGPTTPGSLTVTVEEGTYRIGGVTYGLDSEGVVLGDDILLGINIILGTLAGSVTFDAPPVTGFRYDAIVVGTDGVLDYIKGVEASSNPQKPAIPGAHILVGDYVLMYGGMTEITANDIGRDWTTPVPSALRMLINDEDMAWNPEFPSYSTDTQVQMLDQYGSTIYFSGQFYFQMSIVVGNGELYSVEEGASRTQVGGHGAWHYHFTYTRDGNDPGDWSPLLQGEVQVGAATLVVFGRIILRNAAGEEMPVV